MYASNSSLSRLLAVNDAISLNDLETSNNLSEG